MVKTRKDHLVVNILVDNDRTGKRSTISCIEMAPCSPNLSYKNLDKLRKPSFLDDRQVNEYLDIDLLRSLEPMTFTLLVGCVAASLNNLDVEKQKRINIDFL
mmetsp:Transcript_39861/g.61051  ORF Transcript_39861/g.61051 Transcript_39861/m.61051 type:complete len:102 (+) Transcript_39861:193-498(+)